MSSSGNQTGLKTSSSGEDFPVAAIVCLAVGAYVVIVIIILIVRYILMKKGSCQSDCCSCSCSCTLCSRLNEACPCCCRPNPDGCLSKLCGQRKRTNCVDILLCNCCGCTEGTCDCPSCSTIKLCRDINFDCLSCLDCWDDMPEKNTCHCCCLAVKLRSPRCLDRSNSVPFESTYNTHDQKSFKQPDTQQEAKSVYILPNLTSVNHSVQKRSKSHSPDLNKSHSDSDPLNSSSSQLIIAFQNWGDSRRSCFSSKLGTGVGFDQHPVRDTKSSNILSGNSLPDSTLNLSLNSRHLIKTRSSVSNIENASKSKSRARRSVRPGRQSQRYPNKILVTSESLDSIKGLGSSADSESILFKKSSRSLPQPTNRTLPQIKR